MFTVTHFDPRVLTWWRSQRHKIDMSPPYQRKGHLWSVDDKALLIDSIINDYDVPKVYLADFTHGNSALNEKSLPYAIIDGKQRFETIFDFFDGKLALAENFIYREDPRLHLAGLTYVDLRKNYAEVADKFDNFHLTVMRVHADEEEQINELFIRLNRSKPLTGAEIRNAMIGPAPRLIREIVKHEFFTSSIKFRVERGEDSNAAAKLLFFEVQGSPQDTKRTSLDKFVQNASTAALAEIEQAARRTVDVLDQMSAIFVTRDLLLASAGVIPVYYWFVRHTEQENQRYVREFLLQFEKQRVQNRAVAKQGSKKLDQQLVSYDNFNRSTNDAVSHIHRYEILRTRFETYLKGRKARPRASSDRSRAVA